MKERYYIWWPECEELDSYATKQEAEKLLQSFMDDGCELNDCVVLKGRELAIPPRIAGRRGGVDEKRRLDMGRFDG
jgi:hypothetical protein